VSLEQSITGPHSEPKKCSPRITNLLLQNTSYFFKIHTGGIPVITTWLYIKEHKKHESLFLIIYKHYINDCTILFHKTQKQSFSLHGGQRLAEYNLRRRRRRRRRGEGGMRRRGTWYISDLSELTNERRPEHWDSTVYGRVAPQRTLKIIASPNSLGNPEKPFSQPKWPTFNLWNMNSC
jgi:hypothetical protein